MAAVSISINHGVEGMAPSDFTVGTSAPGTGDFEFRIASTDANGNVMTKKDTVLALKSIIRAIEDEQVPITTTPPL
jgi:hypothetical protein